MTEPTDLRGSEPRDDAFHQRLHRVGSDALTGQTGQTSGMTRLEAISGKTVGAERIWMGETHVAPATASGNHTHGESETAIFVVSGHPEFVFFQNSVLTRVKTGPGDYIFVPPWVPHREENNDPDEEAVVVIARSTQEAIVINVPDLEWVGPVGIANLGTDLPNGS